MFTPGLGEHVHREPFIPPVTTQETLFTITGGAILLTFMLGRVTDTLISPALDLTLQHSDGIAADVFAVALTCTNDAVGTLYLITGVLTDDLIALTPGIGAAYAMRCGMLGGGATAGQGTIGKGILMINGLIELDADATATGGLITWDIWYVPLEQGVAVVANDPP